MAKMFYTIEEAAAKLGVDEQKIKEMAAAGKIQQFRDRDKLMFKRDQVDSAASSGMSDTGAKDAVDLGAEDSKAGTGTADSGAATGISVFDAGEVEPADPGAQTQVTDGTRQEEDLALESVGSGSGLLDLTRESDDTSLGAELLDEIYPASGDSGTDSKIESAIGSSGVFESALGLETGQSPPSGLETLEGGAAVAPAGAVAVAFEAEPADPAGSGFGTGMFLGATVALVLGLIVAISALSGVRSPLTRVMTESSGQLSNVTLWIWMFGLLVLCFVLGLIGALIGKASAK